MSIERNNNKKTLIIGVGNRFRKDDGAGPALIRELKEKVPSNVKLAERSGEGTELMETWKNYQKVFIIDAVQSGKRPGTLHCLDAAKEKIPSDFFHYSTHAFSVAEAVEMARALGELPEKLVVYGIEGKDFSSGEGLSPEVREATREVEKKILEEMG